MARLGRGDVRGIHRRDQVRAGELELAAPVRLHEHVLEPVDAERRDARLVLQRLPGRADEELAVAEALHAWRGRFQAWKEPRPRVLGRLSAVAAVRGR